MKNPPRLEMQMRLECKLPHNCDEQELRNIIAANTSPKGKPADFPYSDVLGRDLNLADYQKELERKTNSQT